MKQSLLKNTLITVSIIMVLTTACIRSDEFERLSQESIDSTTFAKSNNAISIFLESGYEIERLGNKINLSYQSHNQTFSNVVFVKYFDENYIGLITGLPTFDAGWKYLIFPTYSELVILKRDNLEILFRKRVYESISDVNLKNGYVYFKYGEYPDFKYGRFILSE